MSNSSVMARRQWRSVTRTRQPRTHTDTPSARSVATTPKPELPRREPPLQNSYPICGGDVQVQFDRASSLTARGNRRKRGGKNDGLPAPRWAPSRHTARLALRQAGSWAYGRSAPTAVSAGPCLRHPEQYPLAGKRIDLAPGHRRPEAPCQRLGGRLAAGVGRPRELAWCTSTWLLHGRKR
jgi:hypothetical protein